MNVHAIWEIPKIIYIVETWEHEQYIIEKIYKFILVVSTWKYRKQQARNDHSCISILINYQILPVTHLECKDV